MGVAARGAQGRGFETELRRSAASQALASLWGDERAKGWTQSHLVDKDQRSTWTLDTGHGDRPLPGSTGPSSLGQRVRRPPRPPSPISTIQPKANFDAQQFSGTWLLVAVASPCRYLQEQGHRAEATTLHVAPQGSAMVVSTFRKLDGICWAVRQLYGDTGRPGRFLLQARGARGPVDVVVGDTDYRGFAVLYLERARQLSVKLYGTSWGPGARVCCARRAVGWAGWALSSLPPAPALQPKCGDRTGRGSGAAGVRSQPEAHSPAPRAPCRPLPRGCPGARVSCTQSARSL